MKNSRIITPFSAKVVYTIPAMDKLDQRFPALINRAYNGIVFKPIKACMKVSRKTRTVKFGYVHMDRGAMTEEVLSEIDSLMFRPVLPEEMLGFDEEHPNEKVRHPVVALGSVAEVCGCRSVACLWSDRRGHRLDLHWMDSTKWHDDYWFLVVRKNHK